MAILKRWNKPVDAAGLGFVRVALGVILLVEVTRFFTNGWIDGLYGPEVQRFPYLGLGWVQPWPGVGMQAHFAGLGVLAFGLAIGWKSRLCAGLLAVGWSYVFVLDQMTYLNHLYLVCLLLVLFAVIPSGQGLGLDGRGGSGRVPGWSLWILRFQVGVVYVFGGLAKLNPDWLRGDPMTEWMALRGDTPLIGPWLELPSTGLSLSYTGLVFDLLLVPTLMWRRTRVLAFCAAVVFHLGNSLVFHIGIFPWLMLAATTIFFDPSWPRRFLQSSASGPEVAGRSWGLGVKLFLVGWILTQLLIPLRHLAYPGEVSWTEEGHRFAWRMKLRSKKGRVSFHVVDRRTGARHVVDPCTRMSLQQCRKMSIRPGMILQYAHFLRDQLHAEGHDLVAIHADAIARLNQRPPQRLIRPNADLSQIERGWSPSSWIMPLEPIR